MKFLDFIFRHKKLLIVIASVIVVVIVASCLYALVFTRFSKGTVPTDEDLQNAVAYKRVLIFGVDGAGNYFNQVETPNFDRIFGEGNVNFNALSQYPTVSAQNWTSMFHGVRYQTHGIGNLIAERKQYSKDKYPSIFKVYSQLNPNEKMISLTILFLLNG